MMTKATKDTLPGTPEFNLSACEGGAGAFRGSEPQGRTGAGTCSPVSLTLEACRSLFSMMEKMQSMTEEMQIISGKMQSATDEMTDMLEEMRTAAGFSRSRNRNDPASLAPPGTPDRRC
ncbi:MAG: hypothetical protein LBQ90_04785 [Synergistaceae bacterium]|jgi:hypothetical protein|nr:hypothetical protein [Synergistaceae bacterium]